MSEETVVGDISYDGKERREKVVHGLSSSPTTTTSYTYFGPFEIYRKRINGDLDLERESLHTSDGSRPKAV